MENPFKYGTIVEELHFTDRRILKDIVNTGKLSSKDGFPVSTTYSAATRLMKAGYLIRTDDSYEIEDPFFKQWITKNRI
jgi:hypothetical protein